MQANGTKGRVLNLNTCAGGNHAGLKIVPVWLVYILKETFVCGYAWDREAGVVPCGT